MIDPNEDGLVINMIPLPTPAPMTPAPRTDLAGRVLVVADAVNRRVGELTAIIEIAPNDDAIAGLCELLWVAALLRPLAAGPRQRQEGS